MTRHFVGRVVLAALLLAPAGCGPKVNQQVIGTWEPAEKGDKYTIEFTKDGRVWLEGERFASLGKVFRFAKMFGDFGIQPGRNIAITYKPVNDQQMEIMADLTPLAEKLSAGGRGDSTRPPRELAKDIKPRDTIGYTVTADELTLTNEAGESIRLRRVQ
jgi:hypothetical protein